MKNLKKLSINSALVFLLSTFSFSPVANACFTDVSQLHPQYYSICSLKEAGILNGYEDGSFLPENSISRSETLKLLTVANNFYDPNHTLDLVYKTAEEIGEQKGFIKLKGDLTVNSPALYNDEEVFLVEEVTEIYTYEDSSIGPILNWVKQDSTSTWADFTVSNFEINTSTLQSGFELELREETTQDLNFDSTLSELELVGVPQKSRTRIFTKSIPTSEIYLSGDLVENTFTSIQNPLYISEETLELPNQSTPFIDTNLNDWYIPYLNFAKAKKIINGYVDGTFKPFDTITLAESLKIYLETQDGIIYPNESDFNFDDVQNSWFKKYIDYAASKNAIHTNDNLAFPNEIMTRAKLSEVIFKLLNSQNQEFEYGKASYYGAELQGNSTASGEIFDYNKMTAAHKTLPLGSIIEVTNLANNKSIVVKVNDRGPYAHGRIVDLSAGAFEQIAYLSNGVLNTKLRVISSP